MSDQVKIAMIVAVQAVMVALIGALSGVIVAVLANKKNKRPDSTSEEEVKMVDKRPLIRKHRIAPLIGAVLALALFGGWRLFPDLGTKAPFCVDNYFYPSGWMGDAEKGTANVELNDQWKDNCHSIPCTRVKYRPSSKGWAGVYWQYPDGNWGDKPGRKIEGAKKVVFWARGENGGELVTFKVGGINQKKYADSLEKILGPVLLKAEWQPYEIDISDADTSSVIGAFAWSASANGNPHGLTFYIDDICFQ